MVYNLIIRRRTIRRFLDKVVPFSVLEKCVDAARLSPSARNRQELEFVAVADAGKAAELNEAVHFGGSVKEKGRVEGEGAKAFIVIIVPDAKFDSEYTPVNAGIAAEAISLVALEAGLGSCIMGSIDRGRIKAILAIPSDYRVMLAIALGYPAEKPLAEEMKNSRTDYWVDKAGQLRVPKRSLDVVMHINSF